MPRTVGQLITFSIETDADQKYSDFIWVPVKKGDTVQKIAAERGNPEDARLIADLNDIRSIRSILGRDQIRVPGTLRKGDVFHVLAGARKPVVTKGYAKFTTQDRPGRVGIDVFDGYDPIEMEIDVQFERAALTPGATIENDIALLERMGGRGDFAGASSGPPPTVRISTTGPGGQLVPLMPANYQWSSANPSAPTWHVLDPISWGDSWADAHGLLHRQLATVTVRQVVKLNLLSRSATERSKARNRKKGSTISEKLVSTTVRL
jgi:hypothetical protein